MTRKPQSFESHTMIVPGYHRVAATLLLTVLVWFVYRLATDYSADRLVDLVFLAVVLLVYVYARVFPLGVQDRLIRLEETIRLERLLPDDLKPRVPEIRTRDLIALRFASDEELPDLARRVLAGEFREPKEIKRAVRSWRPDYRRI